jgi:hypothetical protein
MYYQMQENEEVLRKPNVLLIGGMKCGSSSLYSDLVQHPQIFGPNLKEPDVLLKASERVSKHYRYLYDKGSLSTVRLEGSTKYSMYPRYIDIPKKAKYFLGSNVKIIYIVRNVYERIESHYMHNSGAGLERDEIGKAVAWNSEYINFSNYRLQLAQWETEFKSGQIFVLHLNDYVFSREKKLAELFSFLEVDSTFTSGVEAAPKNVSQGRYAPRGFARKFAQSEFYLRYRSGLPMPLREGLKKFFGDKVEKYNLQLDESSKSLIDACLSRDLAVFSEKSGVPYSWLLSEQSRG